MSHAHPAGIIVNVPGVGPNFVPNSAILTTRTYHNVLNNIHRSVVTFGRSQGTDDDYAHLSHNVAASSTGCRTPAGRADRLRHQLAQLLRPVRSETAYSDLRSTVVSYLSYEVLNGQAAIRKSPGHFFSDADIYGRHAVIFNQAPPPT